MSLGSRKRPVPVGQDRELGRIAHDAVEVPQRVRERRGQMVREQVETLDDVGMRHHGRGMEPRPARREPVERRIARCVELREGVSRLEGLEPPEADVPNDDLGRAALVQHLADVAEELRTVLEEPSRAPLLADLLVGLREKEDVPLGHDALQAERAHRQRLGESQRLHVVGPAPVQVSVLDPALERGRLLPELGKRLDDVDVVQQQERAAARPAGQPREQVAAVPFRAHDLGLDAVAVEDPLQELGALALAARRPRVDADVVAKEPDGLLAQPLGGGTLQVRGLLQADGRGRPAARSGGDQREDDGEAADLHVATGLFRVAARIDSAAAP